MLLVGLGQFLNCFPIQSVQCTVSTVHPALMSSALNSLICITSVYFVLTPIMLGPRSYLSCIVRCTLPVSTLCISILGWLHRSSNSRSRANGLFLEEMSVLGSRIGFRTVISRDPPWHEGRHTISIFSKRHIHKTIPSEENKTKAENRNMQSCDSSAFFQQIALPFLYKYSNCFVNECQHL